MAVKVAINGLGRIGRNFLRGIIDSKKVELVAANDLGDTPILAHLLQYDSIYGRYEGTIETTKNGIIVDGHPIQLFQERDPAKLPWKKLGVDIAIEATGVFRDREKAALHQTRKCPIISPAGKDHRRAGSVVLSS